MPNPLLPAWARIGAPQRRWVTPALVAVRRHPLRAAAVLSGGLLVYLLALAAWLPSTADLRKVRSEVPSAVVSADGVVLAEFKRINRQWVPLDSVAKPVVQALIATEDHRFYSHHGIDLWRTLAAMVHTLSGDRQGGSTITQQLARNLYPDEIGRSVSLHRKAKEALTALKIEAVYSKDEILEIYLNTVPFLYNAFGIEMAARTYFDKPSSRLNVLESATLIGMLKGASYYNPVQNPQRAKARRNVVLGQMVKHGHLTADRAEALSKQALKLDFERQDTLQGLAPHVAQWVRAWLIEWADARNLNIYSDGLVVRTTLHAKMQKAATQAVVRQMAALQPLADRQRRRSQDKVPLQAGFMAMDPRSGRVLAWVGSRDFATEQFDHVGQARRQPGSTFKPFLYGAAFEMGRLPGDELVDDVVAIPLPGGGVWRPTDGKAPPSGLPMTLHDGLALSKNTITAQLMMQVGPSRVAQLARALGVRDSALDEVPSLALGTSSVTLREMVTAYAAIANEGHHTAPVLVLQVEDRRGQVLQRFAEPIPEPAMDPIQALELVNVLRGAVDEGTASAVRTRYGIDADVAGKTGTTQNNTDGWFILMHPQLVAGARVGFNDSALAMGDGWGPGARSALPIVAEVFQQSLRQRWVDPQARFAIDRSRPAPPQPTLPEALRGLGDFFGRWLKSP